MADHMHSLAGNFHSMGSGVGSEILKHAENDGHEAAEGHHDVAHAHDRRRHSMSHGGASIMALTGELPAPLTLNP